MLPDCPQQLLSLWRMRMRNDNREVAQEVSPRRAGSDFSHVMDEVSNARTTESELLAKAW